MQERAMYEAWSCINFAEVKRPRSEVTFTVHEPPHSRQISLQSGTPPIVVRGPVFPETQFQHHTVH